MTTPNEYPIISLTSGQTLEIRKILLFEEPWVNQIARLRASAAQDLQGVSTGIGFWGSPEWVLGGAAVLGLVEGLLSSSTQKRALATMQTVLTLASERPERAKLFDVKDVKNTHIPHPNAWHVDRLHDRYVHDGDDFVHIETNLDQMSVRWREHVVCYSQGAHSARYITR
jgi:hypothetical protein